MSNHPDSNLTRPSQDGEGLRTLQIEGLAEAINAARYTPDGIPYRSLQDSGPSDREYCRRLAGGVLRHIAGLGPTTPTDGGRDEREAVALLVTELRGWRDQLDHNPASGHPIRVYCEGGSDEARWGLQGTLLAAADFILARQQPPHAGGDAVREAAQALLNACVEDMGYGDETGLYPDRDDTPVGRGFDGPCAVQFGHMRRLRDALATTPPAPGDGKPNSFFDRGVSMGAPTAEPSIRMMAYAYYRQTFNHQKSRELANQYCATLATPGESDAGPGWRLVPIDPTAEMITAGYALPGAHGAATTEAIYRAMLAAAPASSQSKGE